MDTIKIGHIWKECKTCIALKGTLDRYTQESERWTRSCPKKDSTMTSSATEIADASFFIKLPFFQRSPVRHRLGQKEQF